MPAEHQAYLGDCLDILPTLPDGSAELAYLDPPFMSGRTRTHNTRVGSGYQFTDLWASPEAYRQFLTARLDAVRYALTPEGAVFVHCDPSASHIVRAALDDVFGADNFRSEIIWTYRRWSHSTTRLASTHQTIYWYSRSPRFTYNPAFTDYSPTTKVNQILHRRARDHTNGGEITYLRDEAGNRVTDRAKKGVPLGDVWDLPALNPRAKERTGYPTQKPLHLLERIIEIASNSGDTVLDPMCGSGTTLVAAHLLGRSAIGIDQNHDAIKLTRARLASPVRSPSAVLELGRENVYPNDPFVAAHLHDMPLIRVPHSRAIDAFTHLIDNVVVPVRVQRPHERLADVVVELTKGHCGPGNTHPTAVVVQTQPDDRTGVPTWVHVVTSAALQLAALRNPLPGGRPAG